MASFLPPPAPNDSSWEITEGRAYIGGAPGFVQNAALQQGDAMATSAGALLSDRPDEDGPLVLTIPGDISRKAVEAVIVAHQDTPIEAPTSRRDRARAALAAIDRTKITGEAAKLITVLDELVSD